MRTLRTPAENRLLAQRIYKALQPRIAGACFDTIVPQAFLAGLISVENGRVDADASRYEPHVFERLRQVRDGKRKAYGAVTPQQIKDATDAALKNLATSFGYTQIMGYHSIRLGITVAELRDPQKHLLYAVRMLIEDAGQYLKGGQFEPVLRIWNSGSPTGKTHDPHYVTNALAVKKIYEGLLQPTGCIE